LVQTTTAAWWPASNYRRSTAENELQSLRLASPVRGTRKAQSVRPRIARATPENRDGPTFAPRCQATRRTPTYGVLPSPVPLPQVVLRKIARGPPRSFRVGARTFAQPQQLSLSQAKRLAAFYILLCILRYQIHNILLDVGIATGPYSLAILKVAHRLGPGSYGVSARSVLSSPSGLEKDRSFCRCGAGGRRIGWSQLHNRTLGLAPPPKERRPIV
jgi:hypothetical protein